MKKIILLILIMSKCDARNLSISHRCSYFLAPAILVYSYNMLTRMMHPYTTQQKIEKLLWHNNPALLLAFQALTYYCWTQAFSLDNDESENANIQITVSTIK